MFAENRRMVQIYLESEQLSLQVDARITKDLDSVRSLTGRRWDKATKRWLLPLTAATVREIESRLPNFTWRSPRPVDMPATKPPETPSSIPPCSLPDNCREALELVGVFLIERE